MTRHTEFGPCTWCAAPAVVEVAYTRFAVRADHQDTGPSHWRRTRWPARLADLGDVLAGALGQAITRRACIDHLSSMWSEMLNRWGLAP